MAFMHYVTSKLFHPYPKITHTFTTRHGGLSKAPFDTNNLAFHVGDDAGDVVKNHRLLADALGYDYTKLIHMRQIHSDNVVIVDPKVHDFAHPPECDALITDLPGIPLMVMTADCTPVLFFDPVQNVIAVAHAGRAGAIKGIVPKTIEKMCTHYGSQKDNIVVVLGPSIGGCCYEVGETIGREMLASPNAFAVIQKDGKYFLEVNAIIHNQLKESGIPKAHIDDLNICNACENETYFSYRADNQTTGRIAGVIMLKNTIK